MLLDSFVHRAIPFTIQQNLLSLIVFVNYGLESTYAYHVDPVLYCTKQANNRNKNSVLLIQNSVGLNHFLTKTVQVFFILAG